MKVMIFKAKKHKQELRQTHLSNHYPTNASTSPASFNNLQRNLYKRNEMVITTALIELVKSKCNE